MLELLVLLLLASPIAIALIMANNASKDYFDYDEKKGSYISRVTK